MLYRLEQRINHTKSIVHSFPQQDHRHRQATIAKATTSLVQLTGLVDGIQCDLSIAKQRHTQHPSSITVRPPPSGRLLLIQDYLLSHKNASPEILELIFQYVAESYTHCDTYFQGPLKAAVPMSRTNPLTLSHVCRKWRKIAEAQPSLWRCLVLGFHKPAQKLSLWLERSGGTLYELALRLGSQVTKTTESELVRALKRLSWKSLRFIIVEGVDVRTNLPRIWDQCRNATRLEALALAPISTPDTSDAGSSQPFLCEHMLHATGHRPSLVDDNDQAGFGIRPWTIKHLTVQRCLAGLKALSISRLTLLHTLRLHALKGISEGDVLRLLVMNRNLEYVDIDFDGCVPDSTKLLFAEERTPLDSLPPAKPFPWWYNRPFPSDSSIEGFSQGRQHRVRNGLLCLCKVDARQLIRWALRAGSRPLFIP
ncbi:hypothetical protein HGRIS_000939 [Hohenbuehelia grisea]